MERVHYSTVLARRGTIICLIAFAIGCLFYVSHRPVDTRTHDGITIYNEGLPTTWKLDRLMNKYAPDYIDDAMCDHCHDMEIERTPEGNMLIPGDAIYYARDRFLRDVTCVIGIGLDVLLLLPFLIYWHIQVLRLRRLEREEE